jgi:flagellar L-ring protein precursor FlgH
MKYSFRKLAGAAGLLALVTGCASSTPLVSGPVIAPPFTPPLAIERHNNGSIFQANMASTSLFSGEVRPRSIGDSLKVDIAETVKAKREVNTDTSRENSVASKGPGSKSATGVLGSLLNLDASASGSDAFKGSGATGNSSSFTGQLAASVITVLPNGHLVVAGDREPAGHPAGQRRGVGRRGEREGRTGGPGGRVGSRHAELAAARAHEQHDGVVTRHPCHPGERRGPPCEWRAARGGSRRSPG